MNIKDIIKEELSIRGFSPSKIIAYKTYKRYYDDEDLIGKDFYMATSIVGLSEKVRGKKGIMKLVSIKNEGFIGIGANGNKVECLYIYPVN